MNSAAREAWIAAVDAGWADPARLYRLGRRSALLAQAAAETVAGDFGTPADHLMFTEGGTSALGSAVDAIVPHGGTLVLSAVEHSALHSAGDRLISRGGRVRVVGVDRHGRVDPVEFTRATHGADLACLQAANHEVGTRQPVEAVSRELRGQGVPLLVDATMSLGHDPVPAAGDIVVGLASSWGGPRGVGIIAARNRPLRDLLRSADVEAAALPAVLAAARGWEWAQQHLDAEATTARAQTERLRDVILNTVPDVAPLGDAMDRLPHLIAISCLYVDGESLVLGLDASGYAISSGSSCVSDTRRPSHVLTAMGALTQGNLRISLPFGVTEATLTGFADTLPRVVRDIRALVNAPMDE